MSKITIVLENCECYTFEKQGVMILLDGLNAHYYDNIGTITTVDHCLIRIPEKAQATEVEDWQDDWRKRISRDITQVHIDDKCYYVDWGDDEWENKYETDLNSAHSESDEGDYVYIISKTRTKPEDFFE